MRVFVSVDVSENSKQEIERLQNKVLSSGELSRRDVRPVEKKNLHFTLMFLGEKDDGDVERIKEKLAEVTFARFNLEYTGIGGFPQPDRARVVWAGVDPAGAEKILALAKQVASKMEELGFKADKPFSPHMTIFRARGDRGQVSLAGLTEKYRVQAFTSDTISALQLKKSELTPMGPIYSDILTVNAQD